MTFTSSNPSIARQQHGTSRPHTDAGALEFAAAPFEECVFVNCPFDEEFLPLLHAMLFAIHDCGYAARHAMEDAGAAEFRLAKIVRLIRASRLSIHDISRTALTDGQYPRFNMPFEAGLAFGAICFDPEIPRDMLLLDAEPYRDRITLSDLAGQDPRIHSNEPFRMVIAVRDFLAKKKLTGRRVRGAQAIWDRYQAFQHDLPDLACRYEMTGAEVTSFAYLGDWVGVLSGWLMAQEAGRVQSVAQAGDCLNTPRVMACVQESPIGTLTPAGDAP